MERDAGTGRTGDPGHGYFRHHFRQYGLCVCYKQSVRGVLDPIAENTIGSVYLPALLPAGLEPGPRRRPFYSALYCFFLCFQIRFLLNLRREFLIKGHITLTESENKIISPDRLMFALTSII